MRALRFFAIAAEAKARRSAPSRRRPQSRLRKAEGLSAESGQARIAENIFPFGKIRQHRLLIFPNGRIMSKRCALFPFGKIKRGFYCGKKLGESPVPKINPAYLGGGRYAGFTVGELPRRAFLALRPPKKKALKGRTSLEQGGRAFLAVPNYSQSGIITRTIIHSRK